MEVFADGKGVISYVTDEMIAEAGADMEDAEGAIDTMRNIEGVEIAAFIKDRGEAVKVSMRAKSYGRVDGIAQKYNGGGHAKAAGCTLKMSVAEAKEIIKKEIATYLEN
jgi:phosphoesterase RecJ-like protein